ncbi:hypothetical protein [Chryseobacterium indoltheticum]|uniref:hypothetical protein n=1 Tax=Chryseobacterium indoltheticum TaxID=254 RepID=UPI00242C481D|nr:hypothetical protein [Chryseobacterium indoltheticum]
MEDNLCFDSLVLDTFFYAALRKTLELTKPFSYRANKTSLRVIFAKNLIEKFLMGRQILCFSSVGFEENCIEKFLMERQNLCFDSLVLDTFFYAALRKTLELTKPFSYRVNKTSLRVGFAKNRIEKFLIRRQNLCFSSLVLDTFFCAALRKTLELTERLTRAN